VLLRLRSRGFETSTIESLYRLIFQPETKRVYPSFPMTHVMDMPDTLAEIDAFPGAALDRALHHIRPGRPGREAPAVRRRRDATQRGETRFDRRCAR
jgi:hypothetical protein